MPVIGLVLSPMSIQPSQLPSKQVYNELNGEEVIHIFMERLRQVLSSVPYLQRHITLPRVKLTLSAQLDVYADQPTPERHLVTDVFDVQSSSYDEGKSKGYHSIDLRSSVDSSRKGQPADQIREEHNLPIPTPRLTVDSRGQKIAIEDSLERAEVELMPGITVDRTEKVMRGTFITQDLGRAGLDDPSQRDKKRNMNIPIKKHEPDGPVSPPIAFKNFNRGGKQ